ncbi:hypothetical protein [Frankia sp. AgB32]|uniref:TRAFAC clade GTPase domain-containing protein n=1 Tax=Frankia sp. AgB32 TaxID=631119 RepID=UPI00200D8C03|nr:hypothetical protein [Frankia sp. AgB32]MCK9896904.1 hypothetical protein [Frankia sp. AgB32]
MTDPASGDQASHTCVICLEEFRWDHVEAYRRNAEGFPRLVTLPPRESPRWPAEARGTLIRCPNEIGGDPHYFPVDFVLHDRPVVIGFVGASNAGKTCLLAAMSGEIDRYRLAPRGLRTVPVDLTEHAAYRSHVVDPFYGKGIAPPHTQLVELVTYTDAVLLTTESSSFPLVFFDAAGEQLKGLLDDAMALRFLHRVDGLIFVADPTLVGGDGASAHGGQGSLDDPTYTATIAGLRFQQSQTRSRWLQIPSAVAITKSDLLRFEQPVDQWLGQPAPNLVDRDLRERESRDAYAYLHHRQATAWLAPVDHFRQCSLHFVSASGSSYLPAGRSEDVGRFARPARPRRVLEPLVALLDALGKIDSQHVRGG